jgi:hypothetical protein
MTTQSERDKKIRQMLREGRPWKEIMTICRAGPNKISAIKKEMVVTENSLKPSTRTRVFEIFENQLPPGSELLPVVKVLNIDVKVAKSYQEEIYEAIGREDLVYFLQDESSGGLVPVYREMVSRSLCIADLERALNLRTSITSLEDNYERAYTSLARARRDFNETLNDMSSINEKIALLERKLSVLTRAEELAAERLNNHVRAIEKLKMTKEYETVTEAAKAIELYIHKDRLPLIAVVGGAILKALLSNSVDIGLFNRPGGVELFISVIIDPAFPGIDSRFLRIVTYFIEQYGKMIKKAVIEGAINITANSKFKIEPMKWMAAISNTGNFAYLINEN